MERYNTYNLWLINTLNVYILVLVTVFFSFLQFALKQRIDLKEEPLGDREKMMVD